MFSISAEMIGQLIGELQYAKKKKIISVHEQQEDCNSLEMSAFLHSIPKQLLKPVTFLSINKISLTVFVANQLSLAGWSSVN